MSDPLPPPNTGPHRPTPGRSRARGGKVSLGGLPSAEDIDHVAERHKGDAADRFTLYTQEQIEQETRNVRLDMSFSEPIKIRDQAEMIIAAMREVIAATRRHDIGSIRQRVEARREAASLGAALTVFNGKTPYGFSKKKRG
jgi:hypothetical protein